MKFVLYHTIIISIIKKIIYQERLCDMSFSAREKKILLLMLKENSPVSIVKLSEKIGVSKRTVQRELEFLPSDLMSYNLEFASKTGVGVWIIGKDEDKIALFNELSGDNALDDNDKDYRRKKIAFEMLTDKGVKKLFWYSTKFKVSEATVSADIESLETWFNLHDLKIVKKPGSGISVQGTELNYRKAIKNFLSENIGSDYLLEIYHNDSKSSDIIDSFQKSGFLQILGEDTVRKVTDCINRINSDYVKQLTENSYIGLIMHISIAVKRILNEETIEDNITEKKLQPKDTEYLVAQKIATELEEEFDIEIPEVEISYICLHIKASKVERVTIKTGSRLENINLIADKMIYAFDEKMAYQLKQDEEFLDSLLAHLEPTIIRLSNGMNIHNPMLNEVINQYSDVYRKCENSAKALEECIDKTVPPAEIGFLAVHFAAALVRIETNKQKSKVVNIGIVCSSGIGISRLMLSKLKKRFKDSVLLSAYGKNDINDEIIKKEDFLISSISLNLKDIEVVEVSPLVSEKNMEQIRQMINKYEVYTEENSVDKRNLEFETISSMINQISLIENNIGIYKIDKNIDFKQALKLIATTVCGVDENPIVVEDDILKRERISSQIFPELNFALLHAKSRGVKNPSFNIFTADDLEEFKSPDFKGISIIFTMLIPKDENEKINGEIMGSISSSMVQNSEFIDNIHKGDDSETLKTISKILKLFFLNYIK